MRPERRLGPSGRWGSCGRASQAGVIGIVMAMLVGVAVLSTHSAIFSARTITVRGASHLSEAEILVRSGIHPGTNVFYLDTAAARDRLVADPWVASASVARSLPSTVVITIHEVRPVGVTANAQAPMLLAQDGTTLGSPPPGTRLPVVGTAGDGSIRDVTEALGAMTPSLLARVATAAVAADGSITLALRDGVSVSYGDGGDAYRKAQALRSVLTWAANQPIGVESIDVSSPGVPTARLRGTTSATAIAPPSPTRSPSSTPSP